MTPLRFRSAALFLSPSIVLAWLSGATPALADGAREGPDGPNRESTQGDLKGHGEAPKPSGPSKPSKPMLQVGLTVVAPSPDPPWTMRIENTGEHPIRIAADVRLLSFELEKKNGGTMRCAAPAGLRPSRFPNDRELYLQPGESFKEDFDPRLYCFNGATDALTGGTVVHPHYGFGTTARASGPFAAQGLDRPEAFTPEGQIDGPTILLSYRAVEPMEVPGEEANAPSKDTAKTPGEAGKKPPEGPSPLVQHPRRGDGRGSSGGSASPALGEKSADPYAYDHTATAAAKKEDPGPQVVDLNQARMEVFVDRFTEASAARDIVVNIKAENEGRRGLVTALRGRMLSFSVEQLGPDSKARKTVDCSGADRPHGVAADMAHDLGGGQSTTVPLLLAEICPAGTFNRPGLYRVLPRIDTSVDGELLSLHAYIGKALARQSTLVRLATARDAFEDEPPKVFVPPPATEPPSADK